MVRDHSLTELVRDEIERRIEAGMLAPGDKLNEADWAARLQVSRGPVREAFRVLEQAGLVRNEKHRGAFVRSVSAREAAELGVVRTILEEAACRTLATRIDAAQVAALRECLDAMRDALALDDRRAYGDARDAFRDVLVMAAGNGKLHEAYRRCVSELRLAARAKLPGAEVLHASYAAYRAILSALASRKADEAAALIHAQNG
ncbi:GntR family transcriptional regulator [Paraburkholderia adhaesiva]|uniref:GntR family transcriptional regulator n=1 Tax=Paraburkholderia adhaesiva TaxID=2883244 RepID=UPI001F4390BF|nr:GntR family transcriptional regulator [Paraburkholderia adhaesiva]